MSAASQSTGLVQYDAMCVAIATCARVDEAKDIRDRAKALEVYAKQAMNMDAERKAGEIRLRAERRAGEMLREMKATGQRNGTHREKEVSRATTVKLPDLGISRDQSSKWQQLAEIPEQEFEAEISRPGPRPSTSGLLAAREPVVQKRMCIHALQSWDRLIDFERQGLLPRNPEELFSEMTVPMKDDVIRLAPLVIRWLQKFPTQRRTS